MRPALDPFRRLLVSLADWLDYGLFREQLGGKRLRFNDDQRRRLAARAKKLRWRMLLELTTIVTPARSPLMAG